MKENNIPYQDQAVSKAVGDIYALLKEDGGAEVFIDITLRYLRSQGSKWQEVLRSLREAKETLMSKGVKESSKKFLNYVWTAAKGIRPTMEGSVETFVTNLVQNPSAILGDKSFTELVKLPNVWTTIGSQSEEVASLVVSMLGLPNDNGNTKTQISKLVKAFTEAVDLEKIDSTIQSLAVLASSDKQDDKKKRGALFDQKKAGALVDLIDKTTSGTSLKLLQPHKPIIIKLAQHYLPEEINAEKILDGVLVEESFGALNKACKAYKNTTNKTFGLLKAVAIAMTCPKIARITTHALWRSLKVKLLNLVPDFVRRIHSNDRVNDILSKRGDNKDLKSLCTHGMENMDVENMDIITKHILGSHCFKGLDITHHLNDLIISGFDFKRATLGMTKAEAQSKGKEVNFSFANSVISKSDFKDVTFVGSIIDLSGMQIDAESFNSLLPALQKAKLEGKEIKIDHNIKIKGEVQDIASKMEGLDCNGKFTPVKSLDTASKEKSSQKPENNPSKSKPDKRGPSLG